jgi:hypothetical protein
MQVARLSLATRASSITVGCHSSHLAESLAKRFLQIAVDVDRRMIDCGDIITVGGFLAWDNVGRFLVDKILGPGVGAKGFVVSDAAGEARYFTGFVPPQTQR